MEMVVCSTQFQRNELDVKLSIVFGQTIVAQESRSVDRIVKSMIDFLL